MDIEERNYINDGRVRAGERDMWKGFNPDMMTISHALSDECEPGDDDATERDVVFPAKFEVCSTCQGKGKHVNPSIDASGISSEQFDDDPDFREDYFSGAYNVQCYGCHGARVVPAIDTDSLTPEQQSDMKLLQAEQRADAEYRSVCRAERMMGA